MQSTYTKNIQIQARYYEVEYYFLSITKKGKKLDKGYFDRGGRVLNYLSKKNLMS